MTTGTTILASLSVGAEQRPLVQLAPADPEGAVSAPRDPFYALGVPRVGGNTRGGAVADVSWHVVGPLNLDAIGIERVLLAGLSVAAAQYVREAAVQLGDAVLVFGDSPWSLLLLQWARLQGASPLVFARRGPERLSEYASSLGIDAILPEPTQADLARAVKLTHRAAGFAVVFDAIATQQSLAQALSALRDGGRCVLAGIDPQQHVALNAYPDLHRRDLEIVSPMASEGSLDFARMFRFSLDLAEQGRLSLNGLLDQDPGWRVRVASH